MPTTDSEHEMLHELDQTSYGERMPYESSRQATYEDSVAPDDSDRYNE